MGTEFFTIVNGKKQDAHLHEPILAAGNHVAAREVGKAVMKRLGLSEFEIDALIDPVHAPVRDAMLFDAPAEYTQDPQSGRFTGSSGHGFGSIEVDSTLTDVGGDEWNRNTASRLAIEYQKVKPDLETLAAKVVAEGSKAVTEKVVYPDVFDPLDKNQHGGPDYQKTGVLARAMSYQRTTDLLMQRDKKLNLHDAHMLAWKLDQKLWFTWKESSTTQDGLLMQKAASLEFNTQFRLPSGDAALLEYGIKNAAIAYGGIKNVMAYLRAKWETSQYLLDKAGANTVDLYRSVSLDETGHGELVKGPDEYSNKFTRLPELSMKRNGAYSTTTDVVVANHWGDDYRTVLRFEVPRTSLLTLPCYGQNLANEHEVVLLGGAIKSWDAWAERAPEIDRVPFDATAAGPLEPPKKKPDLRGTYGSYE